jgi:hypothetical protein
MKNNSAAIIATINPPSTSLAIFLIHVPFEDSFRRGGRATSRRGQNTELTSLFRRS